MTDGISGHVTDVTSGHAQWSDPPQIRLELYPYTIDVYCMKLRVPGQKLYIDFQRNFIHNYNDVNLFLIISKEKTKTMAGKDSGVSDRMSDLRTQAPVSFKKYMPPPLPYFKVNICPFPLPHFASIFFAYL